MRWWILALLILMATEPVPVGAQETARERARASLPPELFQGIETLASEAEREGIPHEPLFNKALEGMAKRVPTHRLLPAVTAYAGRLRTSRAAFGADATGSLVVAGADALQRGVESQTLRRLGEGEGGMQGQGQVSHPSAVAVLVLADLVEAGVPADRALSVLREALRTRARDHQMLGIPGRVRQLMRQGRSPQDAADQIRQGMQRGWGSGGIGPPVPPGSEPSTPGRRMGGGGPGGGQGGSQGGG